MYHHNAVVQPYLTFTETRFAEACAGNNQIVSCCSCFELVAQIGFYGVKIAVAPRPEVKSLHLFLGLGDNGFSRLKGDPFVAVEACYLVPVGIFQYNSQEERPLAGVLVLYLAFHMNHSLVCRHVDVGGIDIRARRAEVGIEWQCLVELSGDMQPNVFG